MCNWDSCLGMAESGKLVVMGKRPLIVLTGPTAVGKTKTSIALAKMVNGEIISADSMQVYKEMDIGSAKIREEEMDGIRHYLIDVLEPEEEFNVVIFQQMAKQAMEEIYAKGKVPILVGGTGFYIQSVLYDIDFTEEEDNNKIRRQLEAEAKEKGGEALHKKLEAVDPEAAGAIHPNNVKRVIRALEYNMLTGEKISEHNEEQRQKKSPYDFCYFVLEEDRQVLYERIDSRVDEMIKAGLVEEVENLRNKGLRRGMVSMQGLGYKEILDYLEGEISLERAVYLIKRDTRHFAKRQLTWFKREKDVIFLDMGYYRSRPEELLEKMKQYLIERKVMKG